MYPEAAIGAMMRSKKTVIVVDTNQLPPTSFFKAQYGAEEEINDDDIITPEESILEKANIAFHPKHRLLWHYRSKHSSLINFSNKYVYDNELIIFPSCDNNDDKAIELIQTNSRYHGRKNTGEAEILIQYLLDFIKTSPEKSIGVVYMNSMQEDELLKQFSEARSVHKYVNDYFQHWEEKNNGLEELFIKNLERVQGDERDVIFISTVYGDDIDGNFAQRFGPINGKAGKRRLNVLFTRAKEKILTFSSIPLDKFNLTKIMKGLHY